MNRIILLLIFLGITNGQDPTVIKSNNQKEGPICLRNVESLYNDNKADVVCLDEDAIGNSTVTYEYPKPEKLAEPNPRKCFERVIHLKSPAGTHYYISWLDGKSDKSWIEARNFCREMCMDLVSLETQAENNWIKSFIEKMKINEVWTSGRLCNFRGCEYYRSPHMWPREDNGWFWAGSRIRIAPYYDLTRTDWSLGGPLNSNKQPDNRARETTGKTEACIAIINNQYMDGIHWHDEICENQKSFICEENQMMLDEAKKSPDFS